MLVLSRGPTEKIVFPNLGITVEILRVLGNRVRVGIDAPRHISVQRHEVAQAQEPPAGEPSNSSGARLTHQQRNRLHTAQLALTLLQQQLKAGMSADSLQTIQKALREFDAIDSEFTGNAAASTSCPRRALLVEDNLNEAELLSAYLRLAGYDVDLAADGLKALIYLARHRPPDVVLLDMHMPELDGQETVRSIRANPDLRSVKVFAVTGSSQAEAGVSIGPSGVDRWFRKPVNPEQLVREMQRELTAV